MKKLTILAALCALLLGSCTENNLDGVTPETAITLPDLTAGFAEGDTKTYVENGKYLRWHEADLITAFFGNTLNRQYKFKGKTGANSGTFSLVPSGELGTGNNLNAIYAVYPYDEGATITDEGAMTINLPAVQNYAENSFGKGANTMIAVTENIEDTFLGFKNACGYLKLKLYGEDVTLASVEVRGNNGEKIAGSATATMEFGGVPTLAMNNNATTTVTLDCGEGVVLGATAETATELWIVLPETTFEGGITITATDTEGLVFEKSTSNPIVITRNEIQPMKALEAVFEVNIPETWKIYYTATQKLANDSWSNTTFGANIVSNEWDETTGEGVIIFDGEVTLIGDSAFWANSKLTSIIIPDSVISIGSGAFNSCQGLIDVNIPDGVTTIGSRAFQYCRGIKEIVLPHGVEDIDNQAFSGCWNLTSITVPHTVKYIGNRAFEGCTGELILNCNTEYSSYYEEGTFYKSHFTKVTIGNSVSTIGEYAFEDCDKIQSVTIGNNLTTIKHSAFWGCKGLKSIVLPDGIVQLGSHAFYECTSLESVTIGNNINAISYGTFEGCTSLTEVIFGRSVTSIESRAFMECTALTDITIPETVEYIYSLAFAYCNNLNNVYCESTTPPSGGYGLFNSNASGRKIYVPTESVEAYKAAEYWSTYANDIVGYNF